jgi:RNA polymerase sigma-70 factor (ECF subfamily)
MTTQIPAVATAEGGAPAPREATVVPISDRVLLERHVRGDREAFAELMRAYSNPIYGYLARTGVRASERDDLFQEVFCKVHRAARRRLPDGPVRAWIFTIAVNTVRDAFRRRKVRSVVTLDADPAADRPDEGSTVRPDRAAEARETATFLDAQLAKLPLEQREALVLSAVEGLSMEETAAALDAPVNTVKTRVRRARMALADAMRRRQLAVDREGSR